MTKKQAEIFEGLSPAQKIVVLIIEKAQDYGFSGTSFEGFLEWLEEKLDEPNMAEEGLVRVLQLCQAHGYPDSSFAGFLEWLERRLDISDQAVLKEAELEPDPLFSSPKQAERSEFARKLRAGQERSAQQAMVIMANDLQKAYQTIERLRSRLSTDLSFPLRLPEQEKPDV